MAVVDYFLKVEGISGESTDEQHKNEFEIKDWSFGVENPTTIGSATGGAGAGKIKFNEFTIKKTTDKASPVFFKSCATGQHLKQVVLSARKSGGEQRQEFLKITLSDVLVSSYQISARVNPPVTDNNNLAFIAPVDTIALLGGIIGPEIPEDALGFSFAKATVSSQATHIGVTPAASGMLRFDAKTGSFDVIDSPNGVLTVGTVNGGITRGVQEFNVAILIGLLTNPFAGGTLRLVTTEVREAATPPGEVVNALSVAAGAEPHLLHFDVFLYTPADGVLEAADLTRGGKRIGTLTVDPSAPPSTLTTDLTNLIRRRRLETFGIRLQLRGAGLPELNEDHDVEDDEDVEHQRDDDEGTPPADATASFTLSLEFDAP